jgi:hypothetical protein
LEEKEWRDLRHSLTKPDQLFAVDGPHATSLGLIMAGLPSWSKQVTNLVCNVEQPAEADLIALANEGRQSREKLLVWRSHYNHAVLCTEEPTDDMLHLDRRYEHLSTALVGSSTMARLLGAISPGERQLLEDESLLFAHELLRLEEMIIAKNYSAGFYLMQKSLFAKGIVATAELWKQADPSRRVIEKSIFETWCQLMERKTV